MMTSKSNADNRGNAKGEKTAGRNEHAGRIWHSVKEIADPIQAIVKGNIPSWLSGDLLRNGPGLYEAGEHPLHHLFDGFALAHKFSIQNGDVTYQSRFIRGKQYTDTVAQKRLVSTSFGTVAHPDPCKNIFSRFFSRFIPSSGKADNCNVHYILLEEDVYAVTESPFMRKVDHTTLETHELVNLKDYVAISTATAHAHYGTDGSVYNMGSSFGSQTFYNVIKLPPRTSSSEDPLAKASIVTAIPASERNPSYYHSFGMSENYFIFLEQPLVISVAKIMLATVGLCDFVSCINFNPQKPARFHLVKRDTGEVLNRSYVANSFFCFHFINTYEEDDQVIVDVIGYEDSSVIKRTYLKDLRSGVLPAFDAEARRYVLPLETRVEKIGAGNNLVNIEGCNATSILQEDGTILCNYEVLCDGHMETPTIYYDRFNAKKYRYFYGSAGDLKSVLKVDVMQKKIVGEFSDEGCYLTEPIFVPRPDGEDEDDGLVLSMVSRLQDERSGYLVVLDGKTFREVARAEIPEAIAYGFHGVFIKQK